MGNLRTLLVVLIVLIVLVSSVAVAQTVSLKNGDRLTGTILSIDGKKLILKSDYAGDLSIDMTAVESFTSDRPMVVTRQPDETLTGTVSVQGDDLIVFTPGGAQPFPRPETFVLRSPADQAAYEKALHPGPLDNWKGAGNFGLAFASGNSETTNIALSFDGQRKTLKDAWTLSAASIYTTDAKLDATTANSLQAAARYDRNVAKWLFIYGTVAGGYDQLQDLDYRIVPGSGLGLHAIASPRTTLNVLSGFAYTRESYSTGLIRNLTTATVGNELSFKVNNRTTLMQNTYYLPSLDNTEIYHVNANVGISTKLNGWMTANVLFNNRYFSQPVLGNEKNDILLTSGLGFTFGARSH